MQQHWPRMAHYYDEGWIYLGSFHFSKTDDYPEVKGDVYICHYKNVYDGVSVQVGPEETQCISMAPTKDVPTTPVNALMLAYAMQYNRLA